MYVVQLDFPCRGGVDEEAWELAWRLLGAWAQGGQLMGESWPEFEKEGAFRVIALLPDRDALDPRHDSQYAQKARQVWQEKMGCEPVATILGRDYASCPPCDCSSRSALILFTHMNDVGSPLRCGGCFAPVPLFRIPHTDDCGYYQLLCWADDYRSCDSLQMNCTVGERFAERQLFAVDSALSREGCRLREKIESLTSVPTYYFLLKMRGVDLARERARTCPRCGGEWLLDRRWHDHFDFRCDPCRLVSNVAHSLARD